MDVTKTLKWISLFNDKIVANKDYLSELDTPIGDGDHGGNMARGMAAVMAGIEGKEFSDSSEILKIVAMQLLSKVGGASGPLYGSAFMGMAKADVDASPAQLLSAGLDMIKKRGKAVLGEKTMVDVWEPMIAKLEEGDVTSDDVMSLALATKDIVATKGRASYVGERSVGHIDPGSYSSALLFLAMIEAGVK
ncbi:dihydroxyacetone kinase subunit L [Streptococcus iniae]|uniref:dihydroxyacetone kinase subunit DhaL n=1 Tax=Streptococcus iniae TaxID=1346 RepID=UPI0008D94ECE|nr:dihydroxyacetone kinase subunit DhaL [Streptococcus iniae]OHX26731.1 dihydroxyacetone kinase subunit L [Streptococcus iniae]RLV27501.1 dihydroxyacetone kinase subunit L [Streptococcus iniae]